jgi:SAM-dependent methyltransferase
LGRQDEHEDLTGYDRVPYPGHPFAQTHPDRLATVATLFGLRPAAPASCRVLELGCGDGGNLVPMAYGLPSSTFTGIDLAPTAIAHAEELARELGLENLSLREGDVTALDDLGTFDYIVCHGVYSWVEPRVRDALLAICRDHLAPHGVAYVSYDVLPGGHMREITRQMLRWHLRDIDDPAERIGQARALLTAVSEAGQPQAEWALRQSDPALFHDELAEHHEAVLFTDFVDHAARHGLAFLAEADVHEMQAGVLPPELTGDPIGREQYLDFFTGRMFRQTLLCHAAAERRAPSPDLVRGMLAASPKLEPLAQAWPRALPVTDDEAMLRAFAIGDVQLHVWAPALPAEVPERPVASALARLQAARGTLVANLWHASVDVPDDLGRRLITLLDGTRDRAALMDELQRPAGELERSLEGLRRIALLEAVE